MDLLKKFNNIRSFLLNFGPQHPAAHGVLRLILELDGEIIKNSDPHIGLLHRGTEKLIENKMFMQSIPYFDRLDYVSMMAQELTYTIAIEQLLGLKEVPIRGQIIRVIFLEITRILNHLLALTTHALDLGAMTAFLWAFEEREKLMEFYERFSGARLHSNFIRPGGVMNGFAEEVLIDLSIILNNLRYHILQFENLLTSNRILVQRLLNIGVITYKQAINQGFSGVLLRGSGVKWDLRKNMSLFNYFLNIDFEIPVGISGDCMDRFLIRLEEIKQSIKIIKWCLRSKCLTLTEFKLLKNNKDIFPSRFLMKTTMEGLIHHFKLFTNGINVTRGNVYVGIEAPKGEFGVFLESNEKRIPYRCKIRAPGFFHLSGLNIMTKNHKLGDLVAIIGTQDIVFGEIDR